MSYATLSLQTRLSFDTKLSYAGSSELKSAVTDRGWAPRGSSLRKKKRRIFRKLPGKSPPLFVPQELEALWALVVDSHYRGFAATMESYLGVAAAFGDAQTAMARLKPELETCELRSSRC